MSSVNDAVLAHSGGGEESREDHGLLTFCAKSSTLQGFPIFGIKETLSVGIASQLPPRAAASRSGPVIPSPRENTVFPLPDPSAVRDSWD